MVKTHTTALAAALLFAVGASLCNAQLRVDRNSTVFFRVGVEP